MMTRITAADRIGIDLGGTKIDAAVLAGDGAVRFEKRVPTPRSYDAILAAIAILVREARLQAAQDATIGIGAPGSASPGTGLWRNANILACNGRPMQADIERLIGHPVRMENDANCFALSEAFDGAGSGHAVVACFTIGTALGGGLVIDGKVRRGPNNEAAEFGHTPMPWPNESEWPLIPCFCGKKGCVEQYVSGTGLARDYAKATGQELKGPDIVALARQGDMQAKAALDRLADRFARLTAAIVNVIDPDIFVIGGGLSGLPELVEELGPRASRHTFSSVATVKVARAAHGEKSGVRGAARLW
ncbi:ROK family protein [Taklimakanibacter lacteus]|uniref:ROK family protein n=1 Tax=Taklimakanibacter lacteus TaxID=2268456 RepID=UPI0034D450E5